MMRLFLLLHVTISRLQQLQPGNVVHNNFLPQSVLQGAPAWGCLYLKVLFRSMPANLPLNLKSMYERQSKIEILNGKWTDEAIGSPFVLPYMTNPLAEYFKKQQQLMPDLYGEIFITNKHGAMVATTGKLSTLAHAHKYWWQECYNAGKGKIFFDDRGFDLSVQGYVIGIVIPIKEDGDIVGILKSNINILPSLGAIVKRHNETELGEMKIVRTKGLIVQESGHPPFLQAYLRSCKIIFN